MKDNDKIKVHTMYDALKGEELIKQTRLSAIDECMQIFTKAFENNWAVQDTLDALEALKKGTKCITKYAHTQKSAPNGLNIVAQKFQMKFNIAMVFMVSIFASIAIGIGLYERKNKEDNIFQLTTDENKEVISLGLPEPATNIQWLLRIDDWNAIKQWCKGKTDCHEVAIEADGKRHYFTYEELLNYAKTRSTKGDKK